MKKFKKMNISETIASYAPISSLLYKSQVPQILNTAVEVGVFEILNQENLSAEDISKKLETDPIVTKALLNVLTAIELIKIDEYEYELTSVSKQYLVKSSAANQLHDVKAYSKNGGTFDKLQAILKGEKTEFNQNIWSLKEVVQQMEQGGKIGYIQNAVSFVKALPDFKSCAKLCDFAGSTGYYSYALLQENPHLRSHVFELSAVCQLAREMKKEKENFNRVTYHDFDIKKDDSFGNGYDLFFSSNFLYEMGNNHTLTDFLKKVNQSMKIGGWFVSNHICGDNAAKESKIPLALLELNTVCMGYPTHQLPYMTLKDALTEAGFGEFITRQPDGSTLLPVLLLAAKKINSIT
jgi:hypothetical protein